MSAAHPPFERLRARRSLADRLTDALADVIGRGEYPPRSRLPTELEMASRFGVSRTVVREAVARLKFAGLLESRQGSGVYVREPNADMRLRIDPAALEASVASIIEIVELRRGLEAEAAALAAERAGPPELAAVRRALAAIAREERAGRDGVDADVQFHRAIARASGNRHFPVLWDFLGRFLRDAIRATRANESRRAELTAQVRREHQAIVAAIAAGDPAAARRASLRHMDRAIARIRSADPAFWRQEGERYARSLRAPLLRPAGRRGP